MDHGNNKDNVKNQRVVIVKDYPMRNRLMGIFSFPMLILLSTLLSFPVILLTNLGISLAVLITALSEVLIIFFALYYTDKLHGWRDHLRIHNFKWKNFFIGFSTGMLLFIGLQFFAFLLNLLGGGIKDSDTSSSLTSMNGPEKWVILLLFVPIIIPFIEEVFFRGYTLFFVKDSFANAKKGKWWGIIISSLAFSLAHFQGASSVNDIFLVVWIFVIAIVHSFLVLKTDSIYTSFASHFAYNGFTVVTSIIALMAQ